MELDRPRPELPLAQQVRLILAKVGLIELVWWAVAMLSEPLDGLEVVVHRRLGAVASLEFLQHRLSEMGHGNLLVTHIGRPNDAERPPRQRLRSNAAGLTYTLSARVVPRVS